MDDVTIYANQNALRQSERKICEKIWKNKIKKEGMMNKKRQKIRNKERRDRKCKSFKAGKKEKNEEDIKGTKRTNSKKERKKVEEGDFRKKVD